MLKGKHILLGVSSSAACYKALEVVRLFRKAGAEVRVTMTENAVKLVSPLLFEALSGNSAYVDVFSRVHPGEVEHIACADWADAFIIVPATANIIAKLAGGIADDAPTTLYIAFRGATFIAPAMRLHPATSRNVEALQKRGIRFIGPEVGDLASGDKGIGRLVPPEQIFDTVKEFFASRLTLEGKRVLVTAGPTREAIDSVRFVSNRSSGKMGYALAEVAAERGADVVLVSGPSTLPAPAGVKIERVTSAQEMYDKVLTIADGTDIFIFTAAVSDYRPETVSAGKIKKGAGEITLKLVPTPDIAKEIGNRARPDQFLVGFAAETENLKEYAVRKLREKNLNLIIANDVSKEGLGIESDENAVSIISPDGVLEDTGRIPKKVLAARILNTVEKMVRPSPDTTPVSEV